MRRFLQMRCFLRVLVRPFVRALLLPSYAPPSEQKPARYGKEHMRANRPSRRFAFLTVRSSTSIRADVCKTFQQRTH